VSYGVEPSDVTGSLDKIIGLLGQAGDGPPEQEVRGVGFGGDERVRAQVSAFGRLEVLTIDPSLLRVGSSVIAEYVVEAVRAAQEDAQRQAQLLLG